MLNPVFMPPDLCFDVFNLQRMNRESWFPDSYNRCLENFLQAFVPQIISRLKDQPQIAKVCKNTDLTGDNIFLQTLLYVVIYLTLVWYGSFSGSKFSLGLLH